MSVTIIIEQKVYTENNNRHQKSACCYFPTQLAIVLMFMTCCYNKYKSI